MKKVNTGFPYFIHLNCGRVMYKRFLSYKVILPATEGLRNTCIKGV